MQTSIFRGLTLALLLCAGAAPASAWEKTSSFGYEAVTECESENLCLVVGCPVPGKPILGAWLYEHGRGTGQIIELRIDGRMFPLALPERNQKDGLYHWDLDPSLVAALTNGQSAGIVVDSPDGGVAPISLKGSGKAISRVLASCVGDSVASAPLANYLGKLTDDGGCATATSDGVVEKQHFNADRSILDGFDFKGRSGLSFIYVSLPVAMPNKTAVHAQLIGMIQPGAKLRVLSQSCGVSGEMVVLMAVTKIQQ